MSENWTVDPEAHADGTVFILEGADGDDVGIIAQISPALGDDPNVRVPQFATARKMAAASDLYEALSEIDTLVDFGEIVGDGEPWHFDDASAINAAFQRARAALAKAVTSQQSDPPQEAVTGGKP